jgi:flagellar biosynthesis protein FliR
MNHFDFPFILHPSSFILPGARVLGLAWTAPALATPGLGVRFRLALAALLVAVVLPVAEPSLAAAAPAPSDGVAVARACLVEGMIGAALGFSAALIVAGARQAGELVGLQAGLSPAALLDPDAGAELTPLGHLYGLVALALFLVLDGPLKLVRALVESYRVLPVGGVVLTGETVQQAFDHVGAALELVLAAAAPTALALALAGLALGLLGRAAPSLPLMALTLPVRCAVGLVLVMLGLTALAGTLAAAWANWPGPGLGPGTGG